MPANKKTFFIAIAILIVGAFLYVFVAGSAADRGDRQLAEEEYAAAVQSYQTALKLSPWRKELWEKAGIAAAKDSNIDEALKFFKQAPSLSAEGNMWLGYSYYMNGDLDLSISALEKSNQLAPSSSAYNLLALIYRQQKDWAAEQDVLQEQLLLDAGDSHARYRLGLLLAVRSPEQALTNLMLASSLDPQFDPAVQTLRAALNLSATQPDASAQMVTIGRALGLLQEWDLSIAAFDKAISLNAENAEAWAWLGEAKQQADLDGRVELDKAVSLDHTSVVVRALRGLYWNRQKKYPQMLAEYSLAARYDPANPAWQAELGNAYTLSGDLTAALTSYQQATILAPGDSTYWRLLATFCNENGVHVEDISLPAAEKAVYFAPDDPLALDVLGWTYFSTGRYTTAEQTLLVVTKRYPKHYPAHIHLAMTYLALGNQAAAFNVLTYVRDADAGGPSAEAANQLLAKYFP